MSLKKSKSAALEKIFDAVNYTALFLLFLLCIYPFYYIFIYSISNPTLAQKGIVLLPVGITVENYIQMIKLRGITLAALISVLRTVGGTLLTVFCSTLFGYIVTKDKLPFRKLMYRMMVISMYFNAGLIPYYLTMKLYHLNNSFLLYIVPTAIVAFNVILIKTYIEQLPAALEESARIDGARYFTIFIKIIFPLSMPIVATVAVFSAVNQWNSWFDNYLLVQDRNLRTLQLILYDYLNQSSVLSHLSDNDKNRGLGIVMTPQSIRMTITMIVTLPIIFVYPFMQKYFVKGIMLGAIKG